MSDDDTDFAKLTELNTEWNSENENLLVGVSLSKHKDSKDSNMDAGQRISTGSDPNSLLAEILGHLSDETKEMFSSQKKEKMSELQTESSKVANGSAAKADQSAPSTGVIAIAPTQNKITSDPTEIKSKISFSNTKSASTIFSSRKPAEPVKSAKTATEVKTLSALGETKKVVVQSKTVAEKENSSPIMQQKETITSVTTASITSTVTTFSPKSSPKITAKLNFNTTQDSTAVGSKTDSASTSNFKTTQSQFRRPDWFKSSTNNSSEINKPLLRSYKQTQPPKASVKPIVREPVKQCNITNEQVSNKFLQ